MSDLAALENRAREELAASADEAALRAWNTKYFGNTGEVIQALGYDGGTDEGPEPMPPGTDPDRRREILDQIQEGTLSVEAAVNLLRGDGD